jgi:hypothetical protein
VTATAATGWRSSRTELGTHVPSLGFAGWPVDADEAAVNVLERGDGSGTLGVWPDEDGLGAEAAGRLRPGDARRLRGRRVYGMDDRVRRRFGASMRVGDGFSHSL